VRIKVTLRHVRVTIVVVKNNITYCECVSGALAIRHAKCMSHFVMSSVTCQAVQYFSTLSHKRYDFSEKFIEHGICFDFLYVLSVKNFSIEGEFSAILS